LVPSSGLALRLLVGDPTGAVRWAVAAAASRGRHDNCIAAARLTSGAERSRLRRTS